MSLLDIEAYCFSVYATGICLDKDRLRVTALSDITARLKMTITHFLNVAWVLAGVRFALCTLQGSLHATYLEMVFPQIFHKYE